MDEFGVFHLDVFGGGVGGGVVGCGGVGMVVAVLVVLFSTQVCGAFGSAGLLEGDMIGGVMVVMFGALLGFEATSLLTGS